MTCTLLPFAKFPGRCDHCGKELKGKRRRWCSTKCNRVYQRNHRWSLARAARRRRDGYKCVTCGDGTHNGIPIEVNHKTPRNGKGYGWGCWHHLDKLETLCRPCHLQVTKLQRQAKARKKAA